MNSYSPDKPLVSVIVASYNHANFIEACIKSICQQTYKNIELVVIDDGSSDASDELIRQLSLQYGFYYERQKNQGLCNTLNKGLSLIKGDYVCCFASDDVMMLDRIEKQVQVMENNPEAGACSGNMIAINEQGEVLLKQKMREKRVLTFDDIFLGKVRGAPAPTVMIRKAALDEVGGYDPDIRIEDLYMWLKITQAGYTIVHSTDLYSYYRQHSTNTHSNIRLMFENELKIIEDYRSHPAFNDVVKSLVARSFVKASSCDKKLAKELLLRFPVAQYPMKLIKGLGRMIYS
ncbi:glycosyltransferase [Parendozoicomonas haliclonae]|uniref:Putative glycosyltransferase EpsE n=1 Tax=Parendozoicomonas haliclonae TaxID=1960125 RepID=A0A1X7AFV8_9GAMM|nr:glycosyltransferase family A protein [Parendozoicomonas haliclonae]SMA31443.1 putative glycosyltransferase EpsE [Parendozoicomonas haliclonae]